MQSYTSYGRQDCSCDAALKYPETVIRHEKSHIPLRTYFAARPTSHETAPTPAKNIAVIQASEAEFLLKNMIRRTTTAAISQSEAIAKPHQYRTMPKRPNIRVLGWLYVPGGR
jgi:hypothetical protein